MGKPAARVGDNHICPMFDGPKPHVGGPIIPPGTVTVLIGGQPAATLGSHCFCVSPVPDSIMMGSPTVFIGGVPAARLFDPTLHGGSIVFGAATVLIGEFAAVGAVTVFPGQQHFNNCGVQSSSQLVYQATGQKLDEGGMLGIAIAGGYATDHAPNMPGGGTTAANRQALLAEFGVASEVVQNPSKEDLAQALRKNKGVVANVNAGELWNDPRYENGGHAVVITEGDFNERGELTHVYINDTGNNQQGRRLSADEMLQAMQTRKDKKGNSSYQINVTKDPVWTQIR